MTTVRVEVEVEYRRVEKLKFDVDLSDGFGTPGVPFEVARFQRAIHFQVNHARKDFSKKPAILGIRFVDMSECSYCQAIIEVIPGQVVFTHHPEGPDNYFCSEEHRIAKEGP